MWQGIDLGWGVLFAGLIGWTWGSFFNMLISRTPFRINQGQVPAELRAPDGKPLTLFYPRRSVCFGCGNGIAWFDNIPIVSFLWLRGRCRHCKTPIGARSLIVEIFTPVLFSVLFPLAVSWGLPRFLFSYMFLSWVLLSVGLVWEARRTGVGFLLFGPVLLLGLLALN